MSGRRKFLNPDPLGFGGGLNFYAYANGNPISYLDPFGLGAVGEGSSGSYWIDTGREFQGLGSAVGNTASGLWGAVTSPIDTAASLVGNITDYPYETSQAIASGLGNTWNNLTGSDPRAQGQAVGNILIFGGTLAAPFASAGEVAALDTSLTTVSRWGRPGLQSGDWVMNGPNNTWNYLRSGKWESYHPWNEPAPFNSGLQYNVSPSTVQWPSGANWFRGFFGQRTYTGPGVTPPP